jgi:hypothetical protein
LDYKAIIRSWFTDDKNQWDVGFALWIAGVIVFFVLAFWNHDKFDPQGFGIGFGSILAGGGGMSWLRKGV